MNLRLTLMAGLFCILYTANLSTAFGAGNQRTIEMLVRGGPESQREAAQTLYNGFDRSTEVLDVAAEVLLNVYQRPGFVQVDATSWLCKALGASGNTRYRGVLLQVADKAVERKVRKYAEQSLSMLPMGNADPYIPGTVDLVKLSEGAARTRDHQPPASARGEANDSFDRITYGMSLEEVFAIIGHPTSTTSRITGKAWAPFYFGGDTARLFALYKGRGRIVFSNASQFAPVWRVMDIVPDPTESGYP